MKKERIRKTICGEKPDKLAYSFWTHLPVIDLDPLKLAQETYSFYKKYDLDFIKTMNNGMYSIEDFGCKIDYQPVLNGGIAKVLTKPINTITDIKHLTKLSIKKGALAREILSLKLLKNYVKEEAPIIFTIFSPLTTLQKLCGLTLLKQAMQEVPQDVHTALEHISLTTAELATEAIHHGADGVFFASQSSSYDTFSLEEYLAFGRPYDLQSLAGASQGWFNVIHAHGKNIIFELLKDYPVQVFNWHAGESYPEMDEAADLTGKCLMGGLERADITRGDRNALQNQIYRSIKIMKKKNHILSPGCVIRYPLDEKILHYIKEVKDSIETKIDLIETEVESL